MVTVLKTHLTINEISKIAALQRMKTPSDICTKTIHPNVFERYLTI